MGWAGEMRHGEEREGFVPITLILRDRRIEGKVWKQAGWRLLEQIEREGRQFLPIVEAEIAGSAGRLAPDSEHSEVVAVKLSEVVAIIPGDSVTPSGERAESHAEARS